MGVVVVEEEVVTGEEAEVLVVEEEGVGVVVVEEEGVESVGAELVESDFSHLALKLLVVLLYNLSYHVRFR